MAGKTKIPDLCFSPPDCPKCDATLYFDGEGFDCQYCAIKWPGNGRGGWWYGGETGINWPRCGCSHEAGRHTKPNPNNINRFGLCRVLACECSLYAPDYT